MKSTWFSDRAQYDFCRLLAETPKSSGQHIYRTFSDFIECAYLAVSGAAHKVRTGKASPQKERAYLELIQNYKADRLAEAFAGLVMSLEKDPGDFLGNCFQSLGMADKDFAGQCFTPRALCLTMVGVTLGDVKPGKERLTISDPCVGGGAIVLAAWEYLKERGFGHKELFFWAQDKAAICHRMAYVQLALQGVPAWVIRGNSLSGTVEESDITVVGALYPYVESAPPKKAVRFRNRNF